jgi:glycolate oxidase iron-sulfur subunit
MKEYKDLLAEDEDYRDMAIRFSQLTVDITEFLASLPWEPPTGRVNRRITYQDPCHLAHAQRITNQPRDILRSIPGLELVEMEQSSVCCGGAGIYSTVQEEMSGRVLASKIANIAAVGVDQVVTANPGCMIQIDQGLLNSGMTGGVCHVVDILDEAYRAESTGAESNV